MLDSIPNSLLCHTALIKVPASVDEYQEVHYEEYELKRVYWQPYHQYLQTKENRELLCNAILWYDCRRSTKFDWLSAFESSKSCSKPILVQMNGVGGFWTVKDIDYLYDVPASRVHHLEILLV